MREIELGDFSDRELTLLGWQAALKSSNHPPDTDITQYFTPESAFANMLQHWNINQICDFYRMLSDRPETLSIPRKPGTEFVPEGTMEAITKALKCFDDLVNQSGGVSGLHLNGDIAPWDELIEGGRFEAWTEDIYKLKSIHRATQKEIPNAQG